MQKFMKEAISRAPAANSHTTTATPTDGGAAVSDAPQPRDEVASQVNSHTTTAVPPDGDAAKTPIHQADTTLTQTTAQRDGAPPQPHVGSLDAAHSAAPLPVPALAGAAPSPASGTHASGSHSTSSGSGGSGHMDSDHGGGAGAYGDPAAEADELSASMNSLFPDSTVQKMQDLGKEIMSRCMDDAAELFDVNAVTPPPPTEHAVLYIASQTTTRTARAAQLTAAYKLAAAKACRSHSAVNIAINRWSAHLSRLQTAWMERIQDFSQRAGMATAAAAPVDHSAAVGAHSQPGPFQHAPNALARIAGAQSHPANQPDPLSLGASAYHFSGGRAAAAPSPPTSLMQMLFSTIAQPPFDPRTQMQTYAQSSLVPTLGSLIEATAANTRVSSAALDIVKAEFSSAWGLPIEGTGTFSGARGRNYLRFLDATRRLQAVRDAMDMAAADRAAESAMHQSTVRLQQLVHHQQNMQQHTPQQQQQQQILQMLSQFPLTSMYPFTHRTPI